ncbi:MAG: hypothetical protein IJD28_04115 [Deferribacterales bacterium]|nr:hypothetical protein [Deferribacterales bacterium]
MTNNINHKESNPTSAPLNPCLSRQLLNLKGLSSLLSALLPKVVLAS